MIQELQAFHDAMKKIQEEKEQLVKEKQFEKAAEVRDRQVKLEKQFQETFGRPQQLTTPPKPHGLRYNDGKLKWSYVHFASLEPMVRVLMFGAQKYEPFNWQKGLKKDEILESMMRHIARLMDGEINDVESGLPHIGHIQCNAMFYQYMISKELEAQKKRAEDNVSVGNIRDFLQQSGPRTDIRHG